MMLKDHDLFGGVSGATEPPRTAYEKRPLLDPEGRPVDGLYTAWLTLENPARMNAFTAAMLKGLIAGLKSASADRSVVAVVLTGAGDRAFCTGGNTADYAEYYAKRPAEYESYLDLFITAMDALFDCRRPVLCRANGMRVGGGQELGIACDLTVASDLAAFGQAGPLHGSAPVGGSTDILPWLLTAEDALWSCVSCELWSAYRMKMKGAISHVVPVLKGEGGFVRNPLVETADYVRDGEIVYGQWKTGNDAEEACRRREGLAVDFSLLDAKVNEIVWRLANLFPGCLMTTVDAIRAKKKFFWDQTKTLSRHWLAANMAGEAALGFTAFANRKERGAETVDFIRYRRMLAEGAALDERTFAELLGGKNT